jgi:hypothetical protein
MSPRKRYFFSTNHIGSGIRRRLLLVAALSVLALMVAGSGAGATPWASGDYAAINGSTTNAKVLPGPADYFVGCTGGVAVPEEAVGVHQAHAGPADMKDIIDPDLAKVSVTVTEIPGPLSNLSFGFGLLMTLAGLLLPRPRRVMTTERGR